jgi:hypothetical protein
VHRTVSGAQDGSATNSSLSGIHQGRCSYNSPDCPVCTELSGEPTVPTANGRHRDQRATRGPSQWSPDRTGLSGVQCAKRTEGATVGFARKGRRSGNGQGLFMSGGAPDCLVRHPIEGKNCLPNGSPTAPSWLGI